MEVDKSTDMKVYDEIWMSKKLYSCSIIWFHVVAGSGALPTRKTMSAYVYILKIKSSE